MSTRTSLVFVERRNTTLHLYREMLDDLIHLEIKNDETGDVVNVIVPAACVDDVAALLRVSETP